MDGGTSSPEDSPGQQRAWQGCSFGCRGEMERSRAGMERQFREGVRWEGVITYTLNKHKSFSHSAAKTTTIHNKEGLNAPYQEQVISHGLPGIGA